MIDALVCTDSQKERVDSVKKQFEKLEAPVRLSGELDRICEQQVDTATEQGDTSGRLQKLIDENDRKQESLRRLERDVTDEMRSASCPMLLLLSALGETISGHLLRFGEKKRALLAIRARNEQTLADIDFLNAKIGKLERILKSELHTSGKDEEGEEKSNEKCHFDAYLQTYATCTIEIGSCTQLIDKIKQPAAAGHLLDSYPEYALKLQHFESKLAAFHADVQSQLDLLEQSMSHQSAIDSRIEHFSTRLKRLHNNNNNNNNDDHDQDTSDTSSPTMVTKLVPANASSSHNRSTYDNNDDDDDDDEDDDHAEIEQLCSELQTLSADLAGKSKAQQQPKGGSGLEQRLKADLLAYASRRDTERAGVVDKLKQELDEIKSRDEKSRVTCVIEDANQDTTNLDWTLLTANAQEEEEEEEEEVETEMEATVELVRRKETTNLNVSASSSSVSSSSSSSCSIIDKIKLEYELDTRLVERLAQIHRLLGELASSRSSDEANSLLARLDAELSETGERVRHMHVEHVNSPLSLDFGLFQPFDWRVRAKAQLVLSFVRALNTALVTKRRTLALASRRRAHRWHELETSLAFYGQLTHRLLPPPTTTSSDQQQQAQLVLVRSFDDVERLLAYARSVESALSDLYVRLREQQHLSEKVTVTVTVICF